NHICNDLKVGISPALKLLASARRETNQIVAEIAYSALLGAGLGIIRGSGNIAVHALAGAAITPTFLGLALVLLGGINTTNSVVCGLWQRHLQPTEEGVEALLQQRFACEEASLDNDP